MNWFKRKESSIGTDTMDVIESSYPKVVQEIHREFFTAGDKLLATANKILADLHLNDSDKIKSLQSLGFSQAKEVAEHADIKKKRDVQEKIAQAVQDFQAEYPMYKFITEDIAEKICKKYGLVLGVVNQYKGFVPAKNLAEIKQFFLNHPDDEFMHFKGYSGYTRGSYDIISKKAYEEGVAYQDQKYQRHAMNNTKFDTRFEPYYPRSKSELNICAPLSDMDTKGYELRGHKLVVKVPDPVVMLKKRHANGTMGYIIITAWGDEASDEMVVNQKFN
jgi:hypothetical protein